MKRVRVVLAALAVVGASVAVFGVSQAAAAGGPAIAICGTLGEEATIQAPLQASGLFSTVDALNCGSTTPSVSTLSGYQAILAFPDGHYFAQLAMAQNLADYASAGGRLVLAQWGWASCCGTLWSTALDTSGLLPFTNAGAPQNVNPNSSGGTKVSELGNAMVFDAPSSPLLAGVASVTGTGDEAGLVGVASGATLVAHWSDGNPAVAWLGNVVALNLFPTDYTSGNGFTLIENSLLFHGAGVIGTHVGYCSVAGNVNPFSARPYLPGTFLDLEVGQPLVDASYKGATPAIFVQGAGITCGAPPAGYVQSGFAGPVGATGSGGFYPFWKKP